MTNLRSLQIALYNIERAHQWCSPRMAARELVAMFDDVVLVEAPTQDRAIVACPECLVEVAWMNRKHSGIIAREAACPEL